MTLREAYLPSSGAMLVLLLAVFCAVFCGAFAVQRLRYVNAARGIAWLLALAAIVCVERLAAGEGAGMRMCALIAVLLLAMKGVVAVESRARGRAPLTAAAWLRFSCWFGMRPQVFLGPGRPLDGGRRLFLRGVRRLFLGAALLVVAGVVTRHASRPAATPLLLVGLSFLVRFGVFNMAAGVWRARGFDCRALFRAPLLAESLGEFWSQRWNLGFSEMTSLALYRPTVRRWGRGPALVLAFLFSGVLHELAISVPVQAGYGGPLAYFVLQSLAVLAEDVLHRRGWPLTGAAGRGYVWACLMLPLPLLFHHAFLEGVAWPLLPG